MHDRKSIPPTCPSESPTSDARIRELVSPTSVLDWLLGPKSASPGDTRPLDTVSIDEAYDRILAKLILAESREPEASYQTDYRIAWMLVRISQTDEAKLCTPAVLAWYKVLGCHPDHVWPRIEAQRRAMLGTEYNKVRFPKHSASTVKSQTADTGAAGAPIASKNAAPVQLPKKETA